MTISAAGADAATEDLSALSWVAGELQRSLDAAHKAMRRYLKEAQAIGLSDVDSADTAILRGARVQLHQGVGALELVGLAVPARVMRASEAAVQRMISKPALVTEAAVVSLESASFAVIDYLNRLLARRPVSGVAMFPQYRAVQELAGGDRVHPADLWGASWRWQDLPAESGVTPRASDDAARTDMEFLVLALMRRADAASMSRMSSFCAELGAGARAPMAATTWRLAAAFFDAQSAGLLDSDLYAKRMASRLLAQLRANVRSGDEVSERLASDLLFFCARARNPQGVETLAPRLAAVRRAWQLGDTTAITDYETPRLGRFDPSWIAQARKRVVAAKEVWSAVAGGDTRRLNGVADAFSLLGESLERLFPSGQHLSSSLQRAGSGTVAQGGPPSAPLAMEVATAVLYVDAALEEGELDAPDLGRRVERLAQRIDEVNAGGDAQPLEPWIEELYRRVSDHQTMGSVVQELRASLTEVEKHIDQYFRDPSQREVLVPVPAQLQAMRGVLSVLDLDHASQAVLHMGKTVDDLAVTEVDPVHAREVGTFDRLADNLGALGFMIDMLSVQPQLAKSLFRFDPAAGRLSAVMGLASRPSVFAGLGVDATPAAEPLADQVQTVAQAAVTSGVSDEDLSRQLEQLSQRAVAADQSGLARVASQAQQALGRAPDDESRQAARAEFAQAMSQLVQPVPAPEAPPSAPIPESRPAPPGGTGLEDDPEMRDIFIEEAREVIDNARQALNRLASNAENVSDMTEVRRAFHTLKGSSRMVGLNDYGEAGWACEQLYNSRLADDPRVDLTLRDFTGEALSYLSDWIEAIDAGQNRGHAAEPIVRAADALRQGGQRIPVTLPKGLSEGGLPAATAPHAAEEEQTLPLLPVIDEPAPAAALPEAEAEAPSLPGLPAIAVAAGVAGAAMPTLASLVPDLPSASDLDLPALPALDLPAPVPVDDLAGGAADAPLPDLPEVQSAADRDRPLAEPPGDLRGEPTAEPVSFELDLQALEAAEAAPPEGARLPADIPQIAEAVELDFAGYEEFQQAVGAAGDRSSPSPETDAAQLELQAAFDALLDPDTTTVAPQDGEVRLPLAGVAAEPPIAEQPFSLDGALQPLPSGFEAPVLDEAASELELPIDLLLHGEPARSAEDDQPGQALPPDATEALEFIGSSLAPESGNLQEVSADADAGPETRDSIGAELFLGHPAEPLDEPPVAVNDAIEAAAVSDEAALSLDTAAEPSDQTAEAADAEAPGAPAAPVGEAPWLGAAASAALGAVALAGDEPVEADHPAPTPETLSEQPETTEATEATDATDAVEAVEAGIALDAESPDEEPVKIIGPLRVSIPLFNIFLNEADEQSRRLVTELAEWALEHHHRPVSESAVALAHSLAGNSATVGYADLSSLARSLEHALMRSQACGVGRDGEPELFSDTAEEIRRLLHQFAAGFLRPVPPELLERLADHERWPRVEAAVEVDGAYAPVDDEPAWRPAAPLVDLAVNSAEADVVDAIDPDLLPIFEEEAEELLPQLQQRMREWISNPGDRSHGEACLRTLHTFKGGARLAGAMRAGEAAHQLESAIEHKLSGDLVSADELEPLQAQVDHIVASLEALRKPSSPVAAQSAPPWPVAEPASPPDAAPEVADLPLDFDLSAEAGAVEASTPPPEQALAGADEPGPTAPVETDAEAVPGVEQALPLVGLAAGVAGVAAVDDVPAEPAVEAPPAAVTRIDWSRFSSTAEAQPEAGAALPGAGSGVVRVRTGLIDRLVNEAGEVSITRARIESDVRQLQGSLNELTGSLERMRRELRDIEVQAETQITSRIEAAKQASQEFDPLEMDRFTRLQELTRMMAESVNDVATLQRSLQRTLQSTEDQLAAQSRLTRELQDDLLRTRMVDFDTLSERLHRVVRQAAKDTGKQVRLDITGGSIEVDRGVLDRMIGPFEHMLRNSVVHGIELPEQRAGAGKDRTGVIAIHVTQTGNEVGVEFGDDGAGLNLRRIRDRAIERGLLAPEAEPTDAELANLIFVPGFTTATTVTELAGRGVGMDVVRAEVNGMGGRIETSTRTGQGTSFRLVLPLTTAVTQVVMLRCGDQTAAVPSTLIEVVRRIPTDEVRQAYEAGHLVVNDEPLPFFWLAALLQGEQGGPLEGRTQSVVVIRSASQRVALHVDEVAGNQEVVVKHLGPQLSRMPGLAGVTLLPSGAVALIYNPVALASLYGDELRARRAARIDAVEPAQPAVPDVPVAPLVMVVDDSLTVRRVTQRLLEREGYRVLLAKDGVDALERLVDQTPTVILCDIEMPRMDGFEFVRHLRADALRAGMPVIMITSRIAQKHRDHAAQLGVAHYLGKPFSEDKLLELVAQYARTTVHF